MQTINPGTDGGTITLRRNYVGKKAHFCFEDRTRHPRRFNSDDSTPTAPLNYAGIVTLDTSALINDTNRNESRAVCTFSEIANPRQRRISGEFEGNKCHLHGHYMSKLEMEMEILGITVVDDIIDDILKIVPRADSSCIAAKIKRKRYYHWYEFFCTILFY